MEVDGEVVERAKRLAGLLSDERGARTLAELQKLARRTRQDPSTAPGGRQPLAGASAVVGVWDIVDATQSPALHRRTDNASEHWLWADIAEVPPKGSRRRLVLLGESTARGYLLDPILTPAAVLQHALDGASGPGAWQCVDLAKTNARIVDLTRVVSRLGVLHTDLAVIFAGNNWILPRYSVSHLDSLADALRSGGYPTMREAFWVSVVLPQVQLFFERVARVARTHHIRVVLVLPEFNLQGWWPASDYETPPLPAEAAEEWYCLRESAEESLTAQKYDEVFRTTDRMLLLDAGLAPATGHLRGRALACQGRFAEARAAYEASRDSICGLLVSTTPRITRRLQDEIAAAAETHGFDLVDMRAVLADQTGQLPDPQHFLDYCHLSDLGIAAAMRATAQVVTGSHPPRAPELSSTERGVMRLLAACHNAYCGQPSWIVRNWLAGPSTTNPNVAHLSTSLLDLLEGVGPVWAHAATARLRAHPAVARYLAPAGPREVQALGLWTLRECLYELAGERPTRPYPTPHPEVDVLESVRVARNGGFHTPNYSPECAYFRATTRTTRLYFALCHDRSGRLTLVYRNPRSTGSVVVAINGTVIGTVPPASKWSSVDLDIPRERTRRGVNTITVRWCIPTTPPGAPAAADANRMNRGEYPFVLPIFGELFTVRFVPHNDDRS